MRVALAYCATICIALLVGQPATGRPIKVSNVSGWRISAETEPDSRQFGFCKATSASSEAEVSFVVARDLKWEAHIQYEGWKLAPNSPYGVYLALDPEADGPMFKFNAMATGERQITANLSPKLSDGNELFAAIRKWRVLTVVIDDQVSPKLEFQLSGTSDALPALLRCAGQYRRAVAPARPSASTPRRETGEAEQPASAPVTSPAVHDAVAPLH
jgi:hypothetical protein